MALRVQGSKMNPVAPRKSGIDVSFAGSLHRKSGTVPSALGLPIE
jgi:hypothetical protein